MDHLNVNKLIYSCTVQLHNYTVCMLHEHAFETLVLSPNRYFSLIIPWWHMRHFWVNMFLTLLWQHMHLLPNSHAPGVVYKLILNIYCTQVCLKHKQCQVSFLILQEIRTYFVEKALWLAKCNNFFFGNWIWWSLNNIDPGKFNQFYARHSWT